MYGLLLAIPSDDISLTHYQREQPQKNSVINKKKAYTSRVGSPIEQSYTGRIAPDYIVPSGGPTIHETGGSWINMWTLLANFAGT